MNPDDGDDIRQALMEKLRKRFKDKGKGFKKNHAEEPEEQQKDTELEEHEKPRQKRKLPNSVQRPKGGRGKNKTRS